MILQHYGGMMIVISHCLLALLNTVIYCVCSVCVCNVRMLVCVFVCVSVRARVLHVRMCVLNFITNSWSIIIIVFIMPKLCCKVLLLFYDWDKHVCIKIPGYEQYGLMRTDDALCFKKIAGPEKPVTRKSRSKGKN